MPNTPVFDGVGWSRPDLVLTSKGLMAAAELTRTEGSEEDENCVASWVEYRDGEELVQRSAHVQLKKYPEGAEGLPGILS